MKCAGSVQVNPLLLLGQYSDDEAEGEEQMLADGLSGGASAVAVVGQVDQKVQDSNSLFCFLLVAY